jgi:hypothetical protein
LASYSAWVSKRLPDPRTVSIDSIVPGLVEIIAAEGPMPCHRAYRLYTKAAGLQKVGRNIKSIFNRSIRKAIRGGLIEERNEEGTNDQVNRVVWKPGSPAVKPRLRGDRTFQEITPAEIASVMKAIATKNPGTDDNSLYHAIVRSYGFGRMTTNVRERLARIKHMVDTGQIVVS